MKFDTLADFDISVVNQIIGDMPTDFTENTNALYNYTFLIEVLNSLPVEYKDKTISEVIEELKKKKINLVGFRR